MGMTGSAPKIDKGIPVPPMQAGRGGASLYAQLLVGDSMFLSGRTTSEIGAVASGYGKRSNRKFTCRKVVENGVAGVRVWRLA